MQFTIIFLIFFWLHATGWKLLSLSGWKMENDFADLNWVVHSAECYQRIGNEVFTDSALGYCRNNYGSALLATLNLFQVKHTHVVILGWFFILLASILISVAANSFSPKRKLLACLYLLIFVSPPVMLLLERGNFDILIMALVFLSAVAFHANKRLTSLVILSLASVFKFYTLPIVFTILFFIEKVKFKVLGILISFFSTFLILQDLFRNELAFPDAVSGMFGNQILGTYLSFVGINLSRISKEILGVVSLVGVYTLSKKSSHLTKLASLSPIKTGERSSFTLTLEKFFFATFLCCFFGGVNYDYRLMFLLIPGFLELARLHKYKGDIRFFFPLLLSVSWCSFNSTYLQPVADVAILFLIVHFLRVFQNSLLGSSHTGKV